MGGCGAAVRPAKVADSVALKLPGGKIAVGDTVARVSGTSVRAAWPDTRPEPPWPAARCPCGHAPLQRPTRLPRAARWARAACRAQEERARQPRWLPPRFESRALAWTPTVAASGTSGCRCAGSTTRPCSTWSSARRGPSPSTLSGGAPSRRACCRCARRTRSGRRRPPRSRRRRARRSRAGRGNRTARQKVKRAHSTLIRQRCLLLES